MIRKLLLTNDDGIDAPGLLCLASVLGQRYEVHVVAPDRDRSGVSHAFTLYSPLRIMKAGSLFPEEFVAGAWKCSGTPVDCVKYALLEYLREDPPDLVISGINRGSNLSIDTLYSGTVAAALEAHMMGRPALALSLVHRGQDSALHEQFQVAADFCIDYLSRCEDWLGPDGLACYSINVPGVPRDELKGVRYTRLGRCRYKDGYIKHHDPAGRPFFWLHGTISVEDDDSQADVNAVRDNWVSVTPLQTDFTDRPTLRRLGEDPAR